MESYPLGVRRDGSYYTRIEWCSHTESDPLLWVLNIIDDDVTRNGGTWGANTLGPAHLILSFFGEEQSIGKIRFFRNVGIDISVLGELCKAVDIYVSDTDEPRKLRKKEDSIESVPWKFLTHVNIGKEEGWQDVVLETPVNAKYIRFDMLENHDTPEIPWTEMNEIKIYP